MFCCYSIILDDVLLKKYCLEICALLVVVIVLLRTSRILEKFREPNTAKIKSNTEVEALEEERLRYAGIVNI